MPNEERPYPAFVISLIGGIIILFGSIIMAFFVNYGYGMMGFYGGHYMMMGTYSVTNAFMYIILAVGLVCGIVILVAAIMLYNHPHETKSWGTVILVVSIISLIGLGGFFVGAILGIVGGVLALTWSGS